MKLARVQGTVVCTIQHPTYEGKRLMLCALLDSYGHPTGKQEIAVDLVQAGVGDCVLIMSEGNGVRQLLGANAGPIRDVIVGVVDQINIPHSREEGQKDESDSTSSELNSSTLSPSGSMDIQKTSSEIDPSSLNEEDILEEAILDPSQDPLKGAS